MISCKDDPCETSTCQPFGICIDGVCKCIQGYYGEDCRNILIPTKMKIHFLRLSQFPKLNPIGESWDEEDGEAPDLFFNVQNPDGFLLMLDSGTRSSNIIVDAFIDDSFTFLQWSGFDILLPTKQYKINFYDNEKMGQELMAEITFVPFQYGFMPILHFESDGFKFELHVSYEF